MTRRGLHGFLASQINSFFLEFSWRSGKFKNAVRMPHCLSGALGFIYKENMRILDENDLHRRLNSKCS